jgi:hypothetical protein
MATALTPVSLSPTSLTAIGTPTAGDTTGNTIPNSGGKTVIYIENTGATPRTLGVSISRTVQGQAVSAFSFAVAANAKYLYVLGPAGDFGQTVTVTPSHADVAFKVANLP